MAVNRGKATAGGKAGGFVSELAGRKVGKLPKLELPAARLNLLGRLAVRRGLDQVIVTTKIF